MDSSNCSLDAWAMHICTRVAQSSFMVLRWARPSSSMVMTKMTLSPRWFAMLAILRRFSIAWLSAAVPDWRWKAALRKRKA